MDCAIGNKNNRFLFLGIGSVTRLDTWLTAQSTHLMFRMSLNMICISFIEMHSNVSNLLNRIHSKLKAKSESTTNTWIDYGVQCQEETVCWLQMQIFILSFEIEHPLVSINYNAVHFKFFIQFIVMHLKYPDLFTIFTLLRTNLVPETLRMRHSLIFV